MQAQHRAELEAVQTASKSNVRQEGNGLKSEPEDDANARMSELEKSVDTYVELTAKRERLLNDWIRSLKRKLARRDAYIDEMERQDDFIEERLCVIEGKVRGVVREARLWNVREKQLIAKGKEDTLLTVHLAQREQQALKDQRETAARLERAEKKVIDLEEDIAQLSRHMAAQKAQLSVPKLEVKPVEGDIPPLPPRTPLISSVASSSDSQGPLNARKSMGRRARGQHQRSESLGSSLLQQISRDNKNSGVSGGSKGSGSSSGGLEAPSIVLHHVTAPLGGTHEMGGSMRVISPRAMAPRPDSLRASSPNARSSDVRSSSETSSARGSARLSRSYRKSFTKAESEAFQAAGLETDVALEVAVASEQQASVSEQQVGDQAVNRRRRVKSAKVPQKAIVDDDGISAEALAEVEAEIAQLLAGKKSK